MSRRVCAFIFLLPLATAGAAVDFARDVRPVLEKHCFQCHGPEKQKSGLRLDVKGAAFKGGEEHGAPLKPGHGGDSLLVKFVSGEDKDNLMPPEGKGERLGAAEIALLRQWIDEGATWPDDGVAVNDPLKTHWSYQPLRRPAVPKTSSVGQGIVNPIDAFIAAKLAEKGLHPAAVADARTLCRRMYFDVIGLPPSPEELDAFEKEAARDAKRAADELVEKLLASPHFGERWARHWLDVVRFAESHGFEMNRVRPNAWPYRDYVIRAFNEDRPYDRFIREQIAGDALGEDAATGFLVGGPWDQVKSPDPVLTAQQRADEMNDMVSTTSSAFLGVTLGCARCHNHKFDPITQTDYYAVTAMLSGVQHGERGIRMPDHEARLAKAADLRKEMQPLSEKLATFQPKAQAGRRIFIDDATSLSAAADAPGVTQIEHPKNGQPIEYSPGTDIGQLNDAGDLTRLPNLGRSYRYWTADSAGKDFFSWNPHASGRFRIWLSWGAWTTHAKDARYVLDRDGDLNTKDDQTEIARIDQGKFADGTPAVPNQKRWSGFKSAGTFELNPESRVILRSGEKGGPAVADAVLFEEVTRDEKDTASRVMPLIRPPVTHRENVEAFDPVEAKFVRFTAFASTSGEPCLDELEVFTADSNPRNVALAKLGAMATASGVFANGTNAKHKLEHINDGLYGNDHSWISSQKGGGWVQIEFAKSARVNRIVWSRDRAPNGKVYDDRVASSYRIEVSDDGRQWTRVASGDDRLPVSLRDTVKSIPTLQGVPSDQVAQVKTLSSRAAALREQIASLEKTPMAYAGKFEQPGVTHRLHRGDPMMPREEVRPSAIVAFGGGLNLEADAPEQDRRVALADWIADKKNPLTARVIVNRLWHYHFGTGIVDTPSDLGLNGARPTHPELLDWLACELIENGWSLKHIHRLILQSATWRQRSSSGEIAKAQSMDAQNRLLWHFPVRRMEAETLRDTILSVTGKLDPRMGGPGFDLFEPNDNYVKVYTPRAEFGATEFRRMIYQSKPRMMLDDVFGAFDCPDAGQIAPKRTVSTTPLQALNLLNSAFAMQQAEFLAERLKQDVGDDAASQVKRAFLLAFGRAPRDSEIRDATTLIRQHGLTALCRALLNANEFITIF